MIKKQMKNTVFLKSCRKNQRPFQINGFGGCKDFVMVQNAPHTDEIDGNERSAELLSVLSPASSTDEVLGRSLRDYEEQLVWIFTD